MEEQKSEQINLEYIVRFENGLRPEVFVYGIDSKAGEIYGADAFIGVTVGAGRSVKAPSKDDLERHVGAIVNLGLKIDTSIVAFGFKKKLSEAKDDLEKRIYELYRENGRNVVKIQSPEHIELAIKRHAELYGEQFKELAERFVNLFQGFIGEHPGY